jgi:hypothetical protein
MGEALGDARGIAWRPNEPPSIAPTAVRQGCTTTVLRPATPSALRRTGAPELPRHC